MPAPIVRPRVQADQFCQNAAPKAPTESSPSTKLTAMMFSVRRGNRAAIWSCGSSRLATDRSSPGKTSVLEAIYLLGRGRSFRSRRTEQLIRKGSDRFVLFGEIEAPDRRFGVGVEGVPTGIRGKVGGEFSAETDLVFCQLGVEQGDHLMNEFIHVQHRLLECGLSR